MDVREGKTVEEIWDRWNTYLERDGARMPELMLDMMMTISELRRRVEYLEDRANIKHDK